MPPVRLIASNPTAATLRIVRPIVPHYVNFANEDGTADRHGDGNDGEVNAGKFEPTDSDVFPGQDVAPQQASQGRAKDSTEGPVVNTERQAVHSRPECAIRDRGAVETVDLLPGLDNAGEQDRGADVGACKLFKEIY